MPKVKDAVVVRTKGKTVVGAGSVMARLHTELSKKK